MSQKDIAHCFIPPIYHTHIALHIDAPYALLAPYDNDDSYYDNGGIMYAITMTPYMITLHHMI